MASITRLGRGAGHTITSRAWLTGGGARAWRSWECGEARIVPLSQLPGGATSSSPSETSTKKLSIKYINFFCHFVLEGEESSLNPKYDTYKLRLRRDVWRCRDAGQSAFPVPAHRYCVWRGSDGGT